MSEKEEELLQELEVIGNNRWYLTKLFLICMLPSIACGMNAISYIFLTITPEHWCHVPELDNTSWTTEQKRIISSPTGSNGSSCEIFDADYISLAELTYEDALTAVQIQHNHTVLCSQHDFAEGTPSMVVDFDLVCGKTALKSSVQAAVSLGKLLGAVLFGIISDSYGRRASFLWGTVLFIISGPLVSAANSYGLVIIGRIALGAANSGIFYSAFVIMSEIAHKDKRATLGLMYTMNYPIGEMIAPVVAYYVRDWRILQAALSAPAILNLFFYWVMPESPMWLMSQQRMDEAAQYVHAQYRKLQGSDALSLKDTEKAKPVVTEPNQQPQQEKDPQPSTKSWLDVVLCKLKLSSEQICLLFKYPELRRRLGVVLIILSILNFSGYGLAVNVDNFMINRYVFGFFTGLMEAPSYVLPIPLLMCMRRKHVAALLMYVAAAALLGILFIPETGDELNILLLLVASVGRLSFLGVLALVVTQTTELYPTLLRNTAMGISTIFSHVGSMIAPIFVDLVGNYSRSLPCTIFGLSAILAGSLMFVLPETKNKPLPVSIEDIRDAPKELRVGLHQICR